MPNVRISVLIETKIVYAVLCRITNFSTLQSLCTDETSHSCHCCTDISMANVQTILSFHQFVPLYHKGYEVEPLSFLKCKKKVPFRLPRGCFLHTSILNTPPVNSHFPTFLLTFISIISTFPFTSFSITISLTLIPYLEWLSELILLKFSIKNKLCILFLL